MPCTLGYHFVKTAYGLWLPGDDRGHWSEAWDQEIGLIEPGRLHPADPIRLRMAQERMTQPPTRLDADMVAAVADAVGRCVTQSDWKIVAASIEATHMHLLITFTLRDIDTTLKWITDQATKAVHRETAFSGKLWGKGRWREFIFDESHWRNLIRYIERHNIRRGLLPRPYPWIG